MKCVVTAGPTYEPLDRVRRLTNLSTGRLGVELAGHLSDQGHEVTLLVGEQATYGGPRLADRVEMFTTTADLADKLRALAERGMGAVFHAAAVSDFMFGKCWERSPSGELNEINSGKISTRSGVLLAELRPTPKIITGLRACYPAARLVGWKYEVDGDRAGVLRAAERQLRECGTDACVTNGPAYGPGFGLVTGEGRCEALRGREDLFAALGALLA
jgi:phosphopantothenoylcysteine decarboxylase/phosphopantothenate--cysteine ligase